MPKKPANLCVSVRVFEWEGKVCLCLDGQYFERRANGRWISGEIETLKKRLNALCDKQYWPKFAKLTSEEKSQILKIEKRLETIPRFESQADREASQIIRETAGLLVKHRKRLGSEKEASESDCPQP